MSVSHETIYIWIYAQPKGELARAGIILRTGREQRETPAGARRARARRSLGMRSIDERPAEAAGRGCPATGKVGPGHRQGRQIGHGHPGRAGQPVAFCPVALPDRARRELGAKDALFDAVKDLPAHLRKSLTWDQGTEMARHAALTVAADLPVYFAHAHSPWERGTNENTNGLIRRYFPKGTEITGDMDYLWSVADSLNDRPRAILGFRKPSEVFTELMLQEAVIPPA